MPRHCKYIIINDRGSECAIVFDPVLQYVDLTSGRVSKVVAAGFCAIWVIIGNPDFIVQVYGKSDSLNIASRGDCDAQLIQRTINCG